MKYILWLALVSSTVVNAVDIQSYRFTNSLSYQGLESAWNDDPVSRKELNWLGTAAYSYFYRPLVLEDKNRTKRYDVLVDDSRVLHLGFGFRLFKGLFSLSTAYVWQDEVKDPNQVLLGDKNSLQDLNLRWKYTLLENKNKNLALAIMPQLTIPTGNSDYYLSDKSVGYGIDFALEKRFSWIHLTGNLGYHYSPQAQLQNMDRDNMMLTALGAYIPFGKTKTWGTSLEWRRNWTFPLNYDYHPTEIHLSLQKQFAGSITAFASVGTSDLTDFRDNVNGNSYRFLAGVKFYGTKKNAVLPPPIVTLRKEEKPCNDFADALVYFDFDKSDIRPDAKKVLDEALKNFDASQMSSILISGHTDLRGSLAYNLTLSKRRSDAVIAYLKSKGVKETPFVNDYFGELAPIIKDAKSKTDHQLNRRSDVLFIRTNCE